MGLLKLPSFHHILVVWLYKSGTLYGFFFASASYLAPFELRPESAELAVFQRQCYDAYGKHAFHLKTSCVRSLAAGVSTPCVWNFQLFLAARDIPKITTWGEQTEEGKRSGLKRDEIDAYNGPIEAFMGYSCLS